MKIAVFLGLLLLITFVSSENVLQHFLQGKKFQGVLKAGRDSLGRITETPITSTIIDSLSDTKKLLKNGVKSISKQSTKMIAKVPKVKQWVSKEVKAVSEQSTVSETIPNEVSVHVVQKNGVMEMTRSGLWFLGTALTRVNQVQGLFTKIKSVVDKSQLCSEQQHMREQFHHVISSIETERISLTSTMKSLERLSPRDMEFRNKSTYIFDRVTAINSLIDQTSERIQIEVTRSEHATSKDDSNQSWMSHGIDFALTQSVFPLVVGVAESVTTYASQKFVGKIQYSRQQLMDISATLEKQKLYVNDIRNSAEETVALKEEEFSNYLKQGKAIANSMNVFAWLCTGVGLTWMAGVFYIVYGSIIRVRRQRTPLAFLLWTSVSCIAFFVLLFCSDTLAVLQRQKMIEESLSMKKATMKIEEARRRYKAECVWYEIPVSRQISLELRGLFWSLLLQDGFKTLSVDSMGNMVSDSTCQSYLETMSSDPSELATPVEAISKAYGSIVISATKRFAELIVAFAQVMLKLPYSWQIAIVGILTLLATLKSSLLFLPIRWGFQVVSILSSMILPNPHSVVQVQHPIPTSTRKYKISTSTSAPELDQVFAINSIIPLGFESLGLALLQ